MKQSTFSSFCSRNETSKWYESNGNLLEDWIVLIRSNLLYNARKLTYFSLNLNLNLNLNL